MVSIVNGRHVFSSESVAEGHPDKVADQISDSVLDAILSKDPKARVDCETLVMQGNVIVSHWSNHNLLLRIHTPYR